jgi:hypothetical protein
MTKPVVQTQPDLYKELTEQKQLEALVAKKISPKLLDYMYLFAPDISYDLELKNLSESDEDILRAYIKTVDNFQRKYDMDIQPSTGNLLEDFESHLHQMYSLRYTDARALFGEYELFRIPTVFESQLSDRTNSIFEMPKETSSYIFPDVFIYDETGGIDWEKTKQFEATEHRIGRYIAAYRNALQSSHQMFIDLEAITTRGFAFIIIDKQLKEVIHDVLVQIYYFFAGEAFKYLNRGYGLEESLQNVYEFYRPVADNGKVAFMKTLKPLFDGIHASIDEKFKEVKKMNKATHDMLVDDFDELILAYFKYKMVFPRDYYSMVVRGPDEFQPYEKDQNFETILDFYMYVPEGGVSGVALETFFVDFSDEAKILIFQSVTGELENPMFTLKDYLRNN